MHRNGKHKATPPATPTHRKKEPVSLPLTPWDKSLPMPKLSFTTSALLVFATAIACFANSHDGDFVFDDSEAIINNKDLSGQTPLTDLFFHDFWGTRLASNSSHKSYRPLTVLTFRLNAYLAGGLHPLGFHIINIILHGLVSALFLQTFSVFFTGRLLDERGHVDFGAPKASLFCALLFAVHPIHTECVAGVVGRADLLCAFTVLLSFLCYVYACQKDLVPPLSRPSSTSLPWFLVSMFLCMISVLFKEQGITVLGVCSAFDILVQCQVDVLQLVGLRRGQAHVNPTPPASPSKSPARARMVDQNRNRQVDYSWVKPLVMRHIFLFVSGVVILMGRLHIMGSAPPTFQWVDNPHSFANGTFFRLLNYNYIYSLNVWLLLNPWWLCFDWAMGCVPVITSLLDPRILAVLTFWASFTGLLYLALAKTQSPETRMLSMSLAVMVVPFLPATNLLFRVGFVIAERILYLPSAGFCMLITMGAVHLSAKRYYRNNLKWCLYVLLILFAIRSVQRSNEWRKEKTLFESGAEVCPLNAKVHYNIAKIHGDSGDVNYAISKYRQAIRLHPEYDQAMNNLANILKERGELVEAESLLTKATSVRADFAAAWMNLGIVQAALKKSTAAEQSYKTALSHRKKYPDCYYNMGNLYLDLGQNQDALKAWRNATLQKPTHTSAWNNLIILLDNLGMIKELEYYAKEALAHLPNDASILYNVGNALGKAEKYDDSEKYFLKAIKIDPRNPSYLSNLGVLYHRWGKLEEAQKAYLDALKLDPNAPQTLENYQMLQRKLQKQQVKIEL